ncbi:hypothetical protein HYALB_00013056 [Hymenoscyphus albidus]|uniref:Glycoside hydrolase 131 catalytic N-terminal domain-containing protein n=1 Tax=Hymenoscyphus albidus TaxID=595503 RepID=A0A9N9PZX0_9HELO|nr:hypothetical protein HYALB_00013056 [Hymenoscyphus albidus]
MHKSYLLLAGLARVAVGGKILWDGRFNDVQSNKDIEAWSWSNQVGPYQYYIHGPSPIDAYVNLDPSYRNPADLGSSKGVKITVDDTSFWNGQTLRRTELIPQASAPINASRVFYHFSLQRSDVNPPDTNKEHQIAFFENHFTELKSGHLGDPTGITDNFLRWNAAGKTLWSTTWNAHVWHNIAYEVDFDAKTVAFWHSEGADDLELTVPAVKADTFSDNKDFHLGSLVVPRDGFPDLTEDFYFSSVWVESGETITTGIAGPENSPAKVPATQVTRTGPPPPKDS